MLPQWHIKDSDHSAKRAGGRLHLNPHTALTKQSRIGLTTLSKHNVGTDQGNEVTRNSSGNTRPKSSQLAKPLWTEPGLKSGLGVRELVSAQEYKKCRRGMNLPPKNRKRGKGSPHHQAEENRTLSMLLL